MMRGERDRGETETSRTELSLRTINGEEGREEEVFVEEDARARASKLFDKICQERRCFTTRPHKNVNYEKREKKNNAHTHGIIESCKINCKKLKCAT